MILSKLDFDPRMISGAGTYKPTKPTNQAVHTQPLKKVVNP